MQDTELEYVDFWPRVGASLIDMLIIGLVTAPLQYLVYGPSYFTMQSEEPVRGIPDSLISFVLPFVGVVLFWLKKQGWHDKMAGTVVIRPRREGEKSEPVRFETPV